MAADLLERKPENRLLGYREGYERARAVSARLNERVFQLIETHGSTRPDLNGRENVITSDVFEFGRYPFQMVFSAGIQYGRKRDGRRAVIPRGWRHHLPVFAQVKIGTQVTTMSGNNFSEGYTATTRIDRLPDLKGVEYPKPADFAATDLDSLLHRIAENRAAGHPDTTEKDYDFMERARHLQACILLAEARLEASTAKAVFHAPVLIPQAIMAGQVAIA